MNRRNAFWAALWLVLVIVTGYFAFFRTPWGMGYGPWHGWGGGWNEPYPVCRSPNWQEGMSPGWMGRWRQDGE